MTDLNSFPAKSCLSPSSLNQLNQLRSCLNDIILIYWLKDAISIQFSVFVTLIVIPRAFYYKSVFKIITFSSYKEPLYVIPVASIRSYTTLSTGGIFVRLTKFSSVNSVSVEFLNKFNIWSVLLYPSNYQYASLYESEIEQINDRVKYIHLQILFFHLAGSFF